jgi:type I restriction enzyme, S subunit
VSANRVSLRYILRPREEIGQPGRTVLSLYRDHGVVPKSSRDDNHNRTPLDLTRYLVVHVGDLVVNKMKAWQGSIAISDYDGIVSPDYLVCSVAEGVDKRFLHYLLRSSPLVATYASYAKGIRPSQWRLYWDDLAGIVINLPDVGYQIRVAQRLDSDIARIDAIIVKKRRMAALIRERSATFLNHSFGESITCSRAGIPIGLAEHKMVRLGALASVRSGLTLDSGRKLGESSVRRPYLRVANVQDGHLDLQEVKYVDIPSMWSSRFELKRGDVLMTEGGDPDKLGRGTVWKGELEQCLHQNHIFSVRPTRALLSEYLALVTRTGYARLYFEITASKTTGIASTSSAKISAFRIPLMSLDRQRDIVEKVRANSSRESALEYRLEKQIALLREHRQALITAAVTGEMKVLGASR